MSQRSPVEILEQSRTVAVVGISTSPRKEAHRVPAALQTIGFTIVPIHPSAEVVLGERAYPTLADVPEPVDVVEVFRPPAEIPDIVRAAIEIGASAVWTQIGLHSSEGERLAVEAGLDSVQSQCMATTSAMHGIDHTG